MIPANFDYAAPASLDEALALLERHGDEAKVLTGGHSLIPLLKLRLARPGLVVDLRRVPGLVGVCADGDVLVIGGATTHAAIAASPEVLQRCPLLAEVARSIGDVQVRNVGTIGGSLVHADPAADWPAGLIATGARVVLRGPRGEREVPAEEFFVGMLESAALPGEILCAVRVPAAPPRSGAAYVKLKQSASGFAICGAAVVLELEGGRIARARVGVTGVGHHAYRPAGVEAALVGATLEEDVLSLACAGAAEGVDVLADIHASEAYRRHTASVLVRRAVAAAAARC